MLLVAFLMSKRDNALVNTHEILEFVFGRKIESLVHPSGEI